MLFVQTLNKSRRGSGLLNYKVLMRENFHKLAYNSQNISKQIFYFISLKKPSFIEMSMYRKLKQIRDRGNYENNIANTINACFK